MFGELHPIVLLTYFVCVTGFSMGLRNPICLFISVVCAFVNLSCINGTKKALFSFKYTIPLVVAAAIMNPMFNHRGETILIYLANGNPLTLESIVFGAAAGLMIASVMGHLSCMNAVMTSDKLVYLSGKVLPSLSLIFSMTLRFIPRFSDRFKRVSDARRCAGCCENGDGLISRIRESASVVSAMFTWSLENSADTADSMHSRGYGLKGRTAFSLFRFDKRDAFMIICILICAAYIIFSYISGSIYWRYFPSMRGSELSIQSMSAYMVYAVIMVIPTVFSMYFSHKLKMAMKGII